MFIRNSILAFSLATGITAATSAQAATVDTLLSLVIDVSGSIDANEYNLQMQGYINAFKDTDIQNSIVDKSNGREGAIAVNVVQFGSTAAEMLAFTVLDTIQAVSDFADSIAGITRKESGLTNIADGVNVASSTISTWLNDPNNSAGRVVMDVSGDGTANTGGSVTTARDAALAGDVDVINAIAIQSTSLQSYFDNNLVGGTGSFSLFASDFDTFDDAIKRKLKTEITGGQIPLPAGAWLMLTGIAGLGVARRRKTKS
ncbi:DUF1194 domain-containing protein [Lutimaribacter saemankumensis]|uniref:VPLPA-CTERM protein sorting domain-containing protein n=1 Tax=Lutimaribacter saemankumensis TaxID=490829 RepID=A0A1G8QP63_9RHOB|nr:DUF1194 domain-containing protein [Lutimaribacter saemankumensis]SDJ06579.1 VPLPA-CTERM protein sorting domain-containing protein [Lutimaribacter saemankumensis]